MDCQSVALVVTGRRIRGRQTRNGGTMAKNLKDDISRSMMWLRGSLSMGSSRSGAVLVAQKDAQNPLRDIFTGLIAYVLFFLNSLDQSSPTIGEIREKIKHLIAEQEKRAQSGEVKWESYLEARFAVLSWVDELILTSSWPARNQWQHLMSTYYQTLNAGEEFFEHLERLPSEARDIREVYYLCLKLGFLGTYALTDGSTQMAKIQHGLYQQLSGAPNDIRQSYARLFPEAYRKPTAAKRATGPKIHPLWFGLAIAMVALFFVTYWLILKNQTDRLLARLEAPLPAPVPVSVDWTLSLIEALRARKFDVENTSRGVVITLPGVLFEVSSSKLSPGGEERIGEAAALVKRHAPQRRVAVEGHASRERGTLDETNQRLSEDRAKNAAEVLVRNGLVPDRVTSKGLGSSTPVASNDTEEGRRKNRRIEIIVDKAAS
jgi:type VI secretion system protein ImpK